MPFEVYLDQVGNWKVPSKVLIVMKSGYTKMSIYKKEVYTIDSTPVKRA